MPYSSMSTEGNMNAILKREALNLSQIVTLCCETAISTSKSCLTKRQVIYRSAMTLSSAKAPHTEAVAVPTVAVTSEAAAKRASSVSSKNASSAKTVLPPEGSRERVSNAFKGLQDRICRKLESVDGTGKFQEDAWQRPEGGGGRSRVMKEGAVFEQGGVGFSEVWGDKLPPSILSKRPEAEGHQFYATGTSMVLHPRNPYIPTVHLNYRYFEAGPVWWFGGGIDLTPYYILPHQKYLSCFKTPAFPP